MATGPSQFVKFLTTWTSSLIKVLPNWMQQRPGFVNGAKFMYSLILPIDVQVENTLQAINDWGPGSPDASVTALPLIGQSRGLIQGEAETNAAFAVRLQNWRATGKQTGKTEILAQQIQTYLGNNPLVRVIQRIASARVTTVTAPFTQPTVQPSLGSSVTVAVGTTSLMITPNGFAKIDGQPDPGEPVKPPAPFYGSYSAVLVDGTHMTITNLGAPGSAAPGTTIPAGAELTYSTTTVPQALYVTANTDGTTSKQVANWNWDGASGWTDDTQTYTGPQMRQFWSDTWIVVYPGEWSIAGLITPLTGQRVPAIAHDAILRLVAQWKGVHTFVRAIIYSYNAVLFDPATPGHAGNPDGTWGNWAKDDGSGNQIPARNVVDARYWIPAQG